MPSRWLFLICLFCTAGIIRGENGEVVRIGDLWRYQKLSSPAAKPHPNWHSRDFDDTRWRFAASGFEIADPEEGQKPRGGRGYTFHRRTFEVKDPASIRSLTLRVQHEEGFVAYLNGVEVARYHGKGIRYPTATDKALGMEDPLLTVAVDDISEHSSLLVAGENVLAVEGPYTGESLSILSIAATLTANFPRGPLIQNSTTNSVQIIWRTAMPGSSFVRYGLSPALSLIVTNEQLVTHHVVTLTNLTPNTKYFYQVGSGTNAQDNPLLSDLEWFRTLKTSGPITFGGLGDSGYPQGNFQDHIAGVLRHINPDLVIHHGDVIYGGFTDATADTHVFSVYPQMKNTPFFFSAGNHDLNCCGGPPDNLLTNFQNAFYLPTNSAEGTELYYSFDHGDAHFVALFNPWFTSYVFTNGTVQYNWLTNDLANTTKKWKFLFFHHPIANSGVHASFDRDANGTNDQTDLMRVLQPVGEKYDVQLILTGHDHNFEKFAPTNGLHHLVSGGGGYFGLYDLTVRHIATAQHRPIHHCVKVTVEGDTLTVRAIGTATNEIDRFVIQRALPADRVYSSSWNTPLLETVAANNNDGNIRDQRFDLVGPPILPRHGQFANLGEFYVNNDSTNLYVGIGNAMFYRDNDILLFIESPRRSGVTTMAGVGNGMIDSQGEGADAFDCLENLSFSNFAPVVGCIVGDEFADVTTNSFTRPGAVLNGGQGVFRLGTNLAQVTGVRMQQFNRSPEVGAFANDSSADFIEVSVPFRELGDVQPGDVIKVAAVAAGPGFHPAAQTRQLDTAGLGVSLTGSGTNQVVLGAVRVRLAFPPNLDTDSDGLLDNWEIAHALDPNSSEGTDGANSDPDGDGHTNAQEQIAGTHPRDANSVLRLRLERIDPTFYRLSWQAVPGRRYEVEHADNQISNFQGFSGAGWPRTAASADEVFEDDLTISPTAFRTYRVRLVPQ